MALASQSGTQEKRPLLTAGGPFVINPDGSSKEDAHAPQRCYFPRRYLLMLLIALGGMVSYSMRINTSITVIPMADKYHWSSKQQGLVLSSLFFGYAPTQLPWGWLARHFRASKWLSGLGMSTAVLLTLAIPSAAPYFPLIIATRIAIGIAEAPFFPCVTQLLSSWIPPAEMATAVTVGYNGVLVGTVMVFFCTPQIIKYLSWEISFYVYSLLGFAWAVLWSALTTETPSECTFMYSEERHYILSRLDKANANAAIADSEIPWRKVLTCQSLWAICGMAFCASWGFYLLLSWAPTYLHRVHHMSLSSIGFASTIAYACAYVLSVIVAFISDKLLTRGWSKALVRKSFPCLAFLTCAVSLVFLCFYPHVTPKSATICIVVCIIAQGMAMPGTGTSTMDIASRLSGVAQGITNTASQLPGAFAVYVTGLMLPHWTAVWILCLCFYVAAAFIFAVFYSPDKVLD